MCGYRLEDIENVGTDHGRLGYKLESARVGTDQGPGIDLSSTHIR